MRRPSRLGLAVVVLLVIVCGLYTAFWFYVAGRLQDGVVEWAGSLRGQQLEASWQGIRVAGFPLAFRLELSEARLRDSSAKPGFEMHAPLFTASARPWNFRDWRLEVPNSIDAQGPFGADRVKLVAGTAEGTIALAGEGGAALWFRLDDPSADLGFRLAARRADLWLSLPAHPPKTHTEPMFGIGLDVREMTLPEVPPPLHNPLDEIAFGATVMAAIPAAPPRQAAAAWRDAGGTVELDRLTAHWGPLAINGSGTLALDGDLQPIGAFSGGIEGANELLAALVAAGRIRQNDARLAQLALGFLARPGPGGRPEISAPFTLQNGEMFLGPVRLGPAPRITWP